tara:strand:- start:135 stop:269 length:135 start_codon:yes stop_codon:yes gene_type:complete
VVVEAVLVLMQGLLVLVALQRKVALVQHLIMALLGLLVLRQLGV